MLVIFDLLGTVFSLDKVRKKFYDNGLDQRLMDFWLEKVLQSAMASTLAGKYISFNVLAESTLRHIFDLENLNTRDCECILESLDEVEPFDDAEECLRCLGSDKHRVAAITNLAHDDAERLLRRAGLIKAFERIYSADDVKACKPHPSMYQLLFQTMLVGPYGCCMVSAHGSDIIGAESLGINTLYIDRLQKQWPYPERPSRIASSLRAVPSLISRDFGKPPVLEETGFEGEPLKRYGQA